MSSSNLGTPEGELHEKKKSVASFLSLSWAFGINSDVPVLNATSKSRKAIFYTAANTGVLEEVDTRSQTLFQGHANTISATCISQDKKWLATGDIGEDCMVVIWDVDKAIPIQTLFDVDGTGVIALAFSNDARMLAVLSSSFPQMISIWDWTLPKQEPRCSLKLSESFGIQTFLSFHQTDPKQLATNNLNQTVFYFWDDSIHHTAPSLTDKDFNKVVGSYSQSLFHASTDRVLTATSCGNVVVWAHVGNGLPCNRKAFKIVKICDVAITILTHYADFIVLGDAEGTVKFLDQDLRVMNWYSNLKCSCPISSVTFSHGEICTGIDSSCDSSEMMTPKFPSSATIEAKPFAISDFVVGFTNAKVVYLCASGSQVKILKEDHGRSVEAMATHPKECRLLIGSHDGLLQLWDYKTKHLIASKVLDGKISCLSFNGTGDSIGVGFVSGDVQIVDALTLGPDGPQTEDTMFSHCHGAIIRMAFSHDSNYLATADEDRCVTLFKLQAHCYQRKWEYIGKHRSHYKPIQDITFGISLDDGAPRLLSIGQDRMLVEYDLKNSSTDDFRILIRDRIEQSDIPLCLSWYPSVVKEDFLMVSNNQFKIKLFNSTTKMCRKTVLGPVYDSPIQRLTCLPPVKGRLHRYMAYATSEKIGLLVLPVDGNPHKSMALIAHPDGVFNLCSSHDGQYLFSAGGPDTSVFMWKCHFDALEAASALGGEGLVPFYRLIEGGRDGKLFSDLEDYFYYSQLKHQGIDTLEMREVSTRIPLDEIASIMRAVGFYPTEQQIDEMINETKFSDYAETGAYVEDIDIGDFLKLYLNHRPVFGPSPVDLRNSFQQFGKVDENGEITMSRETLLEMLQEKGEHLTEAELAEYMSTLLGTAELMGSTESKTFDATNAMSLLENRLPNVLTADAFASKVLGFTDSN